MKVCIIAPMRGVPYFNAPAMDAAAERLRAEGHEVHNPVDDVREHLNETGDDSGLDRPALLRVGLHKVIDWAEAVYTLSGWLDSEGATSERIVSIALGLEVIR